MYEEKGEENKLMKMRGKEKEQREREGLKHIMKKKKEKKRRNKKGGKSVH